MKHARTERERKREGGGGSRHSTTLHYPPSTSFDSQSINQIFSQSHTRAGRSRSQHCHREQQTLCHKVAQAWGAERLNSSSESPDKNGECRCTGTASRARVNLTPPQARAVRQCKANEMPLFPRAPWLPTSVIN